VHNLFSPTHVYTCDFTNSFMTLNCLDYYYYQVNMVLGRANIVVTITSSHLKDKVSWEV